MTEKAKKIHIELKGGESGITSFAGLWPAVELFRKAGLPRTIDSAVGAGSSRGFRDREYINLGRKNHGRDYRFLAVRERWDGLLSPQKERQEEGKTEAVSSPSRPCPEPAQTDETPSSAGGIWEKQAEKPSVSPLHHGWENSDARETDCSEDLDRRPGRPPLRLCHEETGAAAVHAGLRRKAAVP